MSAISSAQAGNWSSGSTWVGGVAPGNGDTATILHAVTVDVNTTVGTSPASQATWYAAGAATDPSIVLTISGSGRLTIDTDIALTVRGSVYDNVGSDYNITAGLTMNAGSSLIFDASQAVDDQSTYSYVQGFWTKYVINGTEAKPCTVKSLDGYGRASFNYTSNLLGHCGEATYCTFSRIGEAARYAILASPYGPNRYAFLALYEDCTFSECGAVSVKLAGVDAQISFNRNTVIDSVSTLGFSFITGTNSGTHTAANIQINDNVIYGIANFDEPDGFNVTGNYFHNCCKGAATATGFASFDSNFIRQNTESFFQAYGNLTNNFWIKDSSPVYKNYGLVYAFSDGADTIIDGSVFDATVASTREEADLIGWDCAGAFDVIVRNNVHLISPPGFSPGKFISDHRTTLGSRLQVFNNTVVTSTEGNPGAEYETGIGVGERPAGGNDDTDSVEIVQSNLFWTPPGKAGGWAIARHVASTFQDFLLAENFTHNWGFGLGNGSEFGDLGVPGFHCADTGTAMFSSGTPSYAGLGDPQFRDITRNCATYHTAGLGNPLAAAWATSTSYAVGDLVSNSDATFYDGTPINYRCTASHTSGAASEPGVAADWRDNWELATFKELRDDTTLIARMLHWIRRGFDVANPALASAAHDGGTIGAGAFYPVANAATHVLTDALAQVVTCEVTATNSAGSATAESNEVGPIT